MNRKALALLMAATLWTSPGAPAQATNSAEPRHITLREAVELALKHNHDVRLAGFSVDEKLHAKEAEKSSYFPSIHNDSNFARVTDTQLIEIQAGSLGTVGGTPIPTANTHPESRWTQPDDQRNPDHSAANLVAENQARERYRSGRGRSLTREGTAHNQ